MIVLYRYSHICLQTYYELKTTWFKFGYSRLPVVDDRCQMNTQRVVIDTPV